MFSFPESFAPRTCNLFTPRKSPVPHKKSPKRASMLTASSPIPSQTPREHSPGHGEKRNRRRSSVHDITDDECESLEYYGKISIDFGKVLIDGRQFSGVDYEASKVVDVSPLEAPHLLSSNNHVRVEGRFGFEIGDAVWLIDQHQENDKVTNKDDTQKHDSATHVAANQKDTNKELTKEDQTKGKVVGFKKSTVLVKFSKGVHPIPPQMLEMHVASTTPSKRTFKACIRSFETDLSKKGQRRRP
eukprot:TRINITY_DN76086_c0_g1_i1.p1 TRINITY_DN76086_c0_g1~~TRINITY_DN76086_c0_g1_i1.p1  ORF type:complete len:244 (+),score=36.50 TRINITY_DN76086_c0_g1_i1:60-791(+)